MDFKWLLYTEAHLYDHLYDRLYDQVPVTHKLIRSNYTS